MREKFQQFMRGRYGSDDFNKFLSIVSLVILVLGLFIGNSLAFIAIALIVYSYFRTFSRNIEKRSAENYAYLKFWNKIKKWFAYQKMRFTFRKTYRFFKCPNCAWKLRVPKGKGKISIKCPNCKTSFTGKS